ncbi:MAG TPA: hypothetical protein VFV67_24230 [Actinophytocola sp.]|nr:hypothetical protein [Actinophytocola sp.]HEU5473768.1 hypothetical protein [Actinophytocola sp.]
MSDSLHLCGFVYLVGEDEGELSGPITPTAWLRSTGTATKP